MSRKSLAANKTFFQVGSFSWVCNTFIATQICAYKKTCLPSTWQKPAEAALQKHKWEERYFLEEKISIQDWKQDGKQLKKTLEFPVQGSSHSSEDCLRWKQDKSTPTRADVCPEHKQKSAERPYE